ncbi:NAD(P)/FAD-dependent oxidoreductase [Nocardia sp. GTS18]|uniref:NAD(P)/FAD-dependent oxidoreductase n=1 Tax=Nocardia sp. GTS18 TaxID=1778064 RepID=UPI0015EF50A0|nr:NAD(P)/FAD-dependent oxidoreductase [Nocardia sp. GTS18]
MTELNESYDVVVIGGGAAGLNGALMLVRQRRSVLVIDAGTPRNAPADGVHGLLGREGMPPLELVALGREEVRGYGGQVVTGEVVAVDRVGDSASTDPSGNEHASREFRVELADGRSVFARRILVTTGLADELPPIAGLRERWGHDVLHCPYCHGWEVRDQRIAILATGPMAVHQALLFTQLTDDIVFLSHTAPAADEDAEKLAARGVRVVDGEVVEVLADGGKLSGVRLADGTVIDRDALVVGPRFSTRATFLTDLGLTPEPHPSGVGDHIPADPMGRTSAPGVWIAGNATDPMAQVGAAAAAGAMAGAQINAELVMVDTAEAVARLRASEGAAVTG